MPTRNLFVILLSVERRWLAGELRQPEAERGKRGQQYRHEAQQRQSRPTAFPNALDHSDVLFRFEISRMLQYAVGIRNPFSVSDGLHSCPFESIRG